MWHSGKGKIKLSFIAKHKLLQKNNGPAMYIQMNVILSKCIPSLRECTAFSSDKGKISNYNTSPYKNYWLFLVALDCVSPYLCSLFFFCHLILLMFVKLLHISSTTFTSYCHFVYYNAIMTFVYFYVVVFF